MEVPVPFDNIATVRGRASRTATLCALVDGWCRTHGLVQGSEFVSHVPKPDVVHETKNDGAAAGVARDGDLVRQ